MNPDADAMAENAKREIEDMRKSSQPMQKTEDELPDSSMSQTFFKSRSMGFTFSGWNQATNGGTINIGSAGASGGGGAGIKGVTYSYAPIQDVHGNKGICQESYDQGYEDGLKAAKTGDKRIK